MSAVLSDCGRYRYVLGREWDALKRPLTFVMLNPSTADAEQDDPTIRRCIGFAKREGFGSLIVVNLFALRATDPAELERANDPKGPENDTTLRLYFLRAACLPVVAAWGAHAFARRRARTVAALAIDLGVNLRCLGVTSSGAPRHPLYVRSDADLVAWGTRRRPIGDE